MSTSFRLESSMLEEIKYFAIAEGVSTSDYVREAIAQYLDAKPATPFALGEKVFGRYRSVPVELGAQGVVAASGTRSTDRKALIQQRAHAKHRR